MPDSLNPLEIAKETKFRPDSMSLHSIAIINGSNRNTRLEEEGSVKVGFSSELGGKRRLRSESGSAFSWVMKTHVPPLAFFLEVEVVGWERTEIRPEQELVVKKDGWELMVLRSGIMGVSIEPFGDLSGDEELMETRVSAFLFSNVSIALPAEHLEEKRVRKT